MTLLRSVPWWYVGLFAVAVLIVVGPPVCAFFEDRADRLDREAWSRVPGSVE